MRLDHFLSAAGLGSRSDVKKSIQKGHVTVNGVVCKNSALKVDEASSDILVDGNSVTYKKHVYFMLNKPQGIISASRADLRNPNEKCVVDLINEERHRNLFPVGRLDRDTAGFLLITDDGMLAHNLLSPSKHVDKTYYAELKHELSEADRRSLEAGVYIGDAALTLPAKIKKISKTSVYITIHEGRFHQIKRMFEAVENEVVFLKRISMGGLTLDPCLKPGEYRSLTENELISISTRMTNMIESGYFENNYQNGAQIGLDMNWQYADESAIHSGCAVMYKAAENRKNITIGVDAGHGTPGGAYKMTFCTPNHARLIADDSALEFELMRPACVGGMVFNDGYAERNANLIVAQALKEILLYKGYDVLMLRDSEFVQLDIIARTVICNNAADCHISIHFDSDEFDYDKGCFLLTVSEEQKEEDPIASVWKKSDALSTSLMIGLEEHKCKIFRESFLDKNLIQTSFSSVPSAIVELGNQNSDHSEAALKKYAEALASGIENYYR